MRDLYGSAGDDILLGSDVQDVLMGGGGSDLLIGGAGNDDVSGDGTYITDSLNWAVTETHGNDRLRQRTHAEIINSEAANEEITHTWRIAA